MTPSEQPQPSNPAEETPATGDAPAQEAAAPDAETEAAKPPPVEEVDLNALFPGEDTDLNTLFPEPEFKTLLKKIQKNKKDLKKMADRFQDTPDPEDDTPKESSPDTADTD